MSRSIPQTIDTRHQKLDASGGSRCDTWIRDRGSKCRNLSAVAVFVLNCWMTFAQAGAIADPLLSGWETPPVQARLRAYWWWLNGNVTPAAITRDLEEMKAKGFGGALICDAGGAEQDGNDRVPAGPTFFSPEWRALFRHALGKASRLGLEMSLNIQSGWNLGGPTVAVSDAPKKLVWTELKLQGPANSQVALAQPKGRDGYYRDLFVVALPEGPGKAGTARLKNWEEKALLKPLRPFSAPDTTPLFLESALEADEIFPRNTQVLDLTRHLSADGTLRWNVPPGAWLVLRVGCTLNDHCKVSTSSDGWQGYALDPFDAGAFDRYWDAVVAPLIHDAGPHAGRALKYLHTDSWEVEVANWTPSLRTEFRKRRGYDLLTWLPVLTGRILNSRDESNRFLHDFRRTMGDLAIDHHFRRFRDRAHAHKLLIHPESGGPHAVPIDAQRCLGFNDAPMSEFWAWSWRHRIGDDNRFFVKQPASAAHAYGRRLVLAEGFTTIGPHWQERLWDNLKPSFDQALCEGLNLLVWHAFVCSPDSMGIPGQQYFAGTHLNPQVTWWSRSRPFFDYINRCQWMLQQGLPVADVAIYYGDHVPNFTQHRRRDPARVRPGYDYDVLTEEVLRERVRIQEGRWTLPDGVSYALLVIPDRASISLPVLRRLKRLVAQGGRLVGPRPSSATSLEQFPACDLEVQSIASELWGPEPSAGVAGERSFGKGQVAWGRSTREVLLAHGVGPDCVLSNASHPDAMDFIHRRDGEREIYFVSNRTNLAQSVDVEFRVSGRVPELWDAVTGERRRAGEATTRDGRTGIRIDFAPCGSWFVVFPRSSGLAEPVEHRVTGASGDPVQLSGPWVVRFQPEWGGPESTTFESLASWTTRPEEGIRFYSGTATYSKKVAWPTPPAVGTELWLDLGDVRELAEVRVNGQSCGVVWTPPFRVNITRAIKPGPNQLEIDVVNFWPNRIIGDASLAPGQRRTRTNVRKLVAGTPLMESGLLGPVSIRPEPR